jgi:hypothetical protein
MTVREALENLLVIIDDDTDIQEVGGTPLEIAVATARKALEKE